jgi:hypothetical protein
MQAVQQAIVEDRIAKAQNTRPHQLDLSELVAGTTVVEILRPTPGDPGWRGPAELLKIDAENGTAIVEHQGIPYKVSLRHVRKAQSSIMYTFEHTCYEQFRWLMTAVNNCLPCKCYLHGATLHYNSELQEYGWRYVPPELEQTETDVYRFAKLAAEALGLPQFHGIKFGLSMRKLQPPRYSTGVLLFWIQNTSSYSFAEHNDDTVINLSKTGCKDTDKQCCMYLYGIQATTTINTPSSALVPEPAAVHSDQTDISMSPSSIIQMDTSVSLKRDTVETRTVLLAPETKIQRTSDSTSVHFIEQYDDQYHATVLSTTCYTLYTAQ